MTVIENRETPGPIPNPAVKPVLVPYAYLDARAPGKYGMLSLLYPNIYKDVKNY